MNLAVGILILITGTAIVAVGLGLAVAEIITGRRGARGSIATTMAGVDWNGIAAVLNGLAAVLKALHDWPLSALLVLLGLIADGIGIWVMVAKPI
jgi:hypothetical protein